MELIFADFTLHIAQHTQYIYIYIYIYRYTLNFRGLDDNSDNHKN